MNHFATEVTRGENTSSAHSNDQEIQNPAPGFTTISGNEHGRNKYPGSDEGKLQMAG